MLAELAVDLTLTTNASLLPKKAQALKDAGLKRITVSLDSLDDAIFQRDERRRLPGRARARGDRGRAGGRACRSRSTASSSAASTSTRSSSSRATSAAPATSLRFIEFMDVGATNGWRMDDVVPAAEIVAHARRRVPVEPVDAHYRGEVAKRWQYKDGSGEIGVIASVTQPFCGDCTRSRLSAEGKLYTCLFAVRGHDLRALIRGGATDEEIAAKLRRDLARPRRPLLRAPLRRTTVDPAIGERKVEMSYIGG